MSRSFPWSGSFLTHLSLLTLTASAALTQGTILFDTRVPGVVDAPVFFWTGEKAGPEFVATLFAGPDLDSLIPVWPLAFGQGADRGYVTGQSAVTVTVPAVLPGEMAWVQLRAEAGWGPADGSPRPRGWSNLIQVQTGGSGNPATPPAFLAGLEGFYIIPEPSAAALVLLGAGILALRRFVPRIGGRFRC